MGHEEATQLAPGLLLATPQLVDPRFVRAVVLLIEHGVKGSFGLVINHPSPISATELLESLDMAWQGDDAAVVWSGGPMSPQTGWVLHEPVGCKEAGTIRITSTISLSMTPDRLRAISAAPPLRVRLLLGYANWSPGQLVREFALGLWIHAPADPAIVFETPATEMWLRAVRSLGIEPGDLAHAAGQN